MSDHSAGRALFIFGCTALIGPHACVLLEGLSLSLRHVKLGACRRKWSVQNGTWLRPVFVAEGLPLPIPQPSKYPYHSTPGTRRRSSLQQSTIAIHHSSINPIPQRGFATQPRVGRGTRPTLGSMCEKIPTLPRHSRCLLPSINMSIRFA